jgi:hypothetical protein
MPLLVKAKDFSALPAANVAFVEPMYALAVQKLPRANNGSTRSNLTATAVLLAEIQPGWRFGRGEKISSQNNSRILPVRVNDFRPTRY